jgi:hypothetical protein
MATLTVIVSLEAALHVILWAALYYKVQHTPLAVWQALQRTRAADENRALDVLQAAAASRIAGLVLALQSHHEHLAALVRAQIADAEMRARVSERRSSEAGIALDAASTLVRDLRTLAEDLPSLFDRRALQTGIALGEAAARGPETFRKLDRPEPASRERPSPRVGPPLPAVPAQNDAERPSEDELTSVASHPLPSPREAGQTLVSPGEKGGAS